MKKNIFIVASGTGGHVIPAKNIGKTEIDNIFIRLMILKFDKKEKVIKAKKSKIILPKSL